MPPGSGYTLSSEGRVSVGLCVLLYSEWGSILNLPSETCLLHFSFTTLARELWDMQHNTESSLKKKKNWKIKSSAGGF